MAKQQLIDELEQILEKIHLFIEERLESDDKEHSISKETLMGFTLISNKDIPPEACSDLKLMERIHEAEVFFDNLKIELKLQENTY